MISSFGTFYYLFNDVNFIGKLGFALKKCFGRPQNDWKFYRCFLNSLLRNQLKCVLVLTFLNRMHYILGVVLLNGVSGSFGSCIPAVRRNSVQFRK